MIKTLPEYSRFKVFINLFLCIACGLNSHGQKCNTGLGKDSIKVIINEQFGNLINQESTTSIGNFASLDLKEASVNFNGNIIFKSGYVLGLKVKGAVEDGFLPIYNNDKLNTDFGIEVQLNMLTFNQNLRYENIECEKYYAAIQKINNEYEIKRVEILQEMQKNILQSEMQTISKKISNLENKRNSSKSSLQKDSLSIEISKLYINMEYKQEQLNNPSRVRNQKDELEKWKLSELEKARRKIVPSGFSIHWLSVGAGFSNSEFRLFDQSKPIADQVSKNTYAAFKANLQLSWYKIDYNANTSYFVGGGLRYQLGDNRYLLDKADIVENSTSGSSPFTRTKTLKYTAYEGNYQKNINSVSLYTDFYWFLFMKNQGGIHVYPEYKIMDKLKPISNFGLGLVLNFKNKEKTKNSINTELYFTFQDLDNNSQSESNLVKRSTYGMRFTFPINFNFKN